ncbi:MAG: hypothetical protein LBM96_06035 [Methanobrevibacter sp.]|jgi:hypothetical protein|nr:hypothetical protein [Candidatus Methanoflexus mossambicus]
MTIYDIKQFINDTKDFINELQQKVDEFNKIGKTEEIYQNVNDDDIISYIQDSLDELSNNFNNLRNSDEQIMIDFLNNLYYFDNYSSFLNYLYEKDIIEHGIENEIIFEELKQKIKDEYNIE